MGLDMYAYRVEKKYKTPVITDDIEEVDEIYYWRKNRHLHNLMKWLYIKKGGKSEFNTVYVELTADDIDLLEGMITSGAIEQFDEQGFYFGHNDYDSKDYDLKFIEVAREVLAEGDKVYYYCWW